MRLMENVRQPKKVLRSFGLGVTVFLAQCEPANPGCQPAVDPNAVTVPANSPAYTTNGGFRKAQAPNRDVVGIQPNPYLTAEQMQASVDMWNRALGRTVLVVTNNAPDITFEINDSLVGGGNSFRPFSEGSINPDGSFAGGKIVFDPDHTRDTNGFIYQLGHEYGHRVFGLKDITDGVSQTLDTNIPQQCYSAAAPGYMGAASIMAYCADTQSAVPTAADIQSAHALGF